VTASAHLAKLSSGLVAPRTASSTQWSRGTWVFSGRERLRQVVAVFVITSTVVFMPENSRSVLCKRIKMRNFMRPPARAFDAAQTRAVGEPRAIIASKSG